MTSAKLDPKAQRMSLRENPLTRMLAKEKQIKHDRLVSPEPPRNTAMQTEPLSGSTSPPAPMPAPSLQQAPVRRPFPRSQTVPIMPINTQRANEGVFHAGDVGMSQNMNDDEEGSLRSSICHSPSWSDHGRKERKAEQKVREKERKKAERDKKDLEKRMKKDEEKRKAADLKAIQAGKRLSKPLPPAAMDTQRASSGLRRNSLASVFSSRPGSRDNSGRSSREEKRTSSFSFGSFKDKRSSSTPPSSTELCSDTLDQQLGLISKDAPQLPQIPKIPGLGGFHSRNGSSETDRTKSWGSDDDAFQEQLAKYARKTSKEASAKYKRPIDLTDKKELQDFISSSHPPRSSVGRALHPLNRSETEPDLTKVLPDLSTKKETQQKPLAQPRGHDPSTTKEAQQKPLAQPGGHDPSTTKETQQKLLVKTAGLDPSAKREAQQKLLAKPVRPNPSTNKETEQKLLAQPAGPDPNVIRGRHQNQQAKPQDLDRRGVRKQESAQDGMELAKPARPGSRDGPLEKVVIRFGINPATFDIPEMPSLQPIYKPELRNLPEIMVPEYFGRPYDGSSYVHKQRMNHQQLSIAGFQEEQTIKRANEQGLENKGDKPVRSEALSSRETAHGSNQSTGEDPWNSSVRCRVPRMEEVDQQAPYRVLGPPSARPVIEKSILRRGVIGRKSESPEDPPSPAREKPDSMLKPAEDLKPENADEAGSEAGNGNTKAQRDLVLEAPNPFSHSRTRTASSQLFNDDLPVSSKSSKPLPRSSTTPVLITTKTLPLLVTENKAEVNKRPPTPPKPAPELTISSTTSEGIVRQTSIKRPRSNPALPSLDFLPQLKHQPLTKPKRSSPVRSSFAGPSPSPSAPKSSGGDLSVIPRSPFAPRPTSQPLPGPTDLRIHRAVVPPHPRRTSHQPLAHPNNLARKQQMAEPLAKMFVVCCKCQFWHDLPSELYKAMAVGEGFGPGGEAKGGMVDAAVKCPWCGHFMSKYCCEGWMTVVYMEQKMHPL